VNLPSLQGVMFLVIVEFWNIREPIVVSFHS
jgi:hypothetical protein